MLLLSLSLRQRFFVAMKAQRPYSLMRWKAVREKGLVLMRNKALQMIYPLLGVAAFLLIWQLFAAYVVSAGWLLPTPLAVLGSIVKNLDLLLRHSRYTAIESMLGLLLSVLLSLLLAGLLSLSKRLSQMIYPLLLMSQMIPIVVLAPLFLIWFGYGMLPKALVVILICFFPMVINILAGLNAVSREMLAYYQAMGMSRAQQFSRLRLPYALPYFFGGLRVSAAYSVMGAVIGEWLGAEGGLGFLLTRAQRSFDLPLVFAAIVSIIILSALIFLLVYVGEYLALGWKRAESEQKWN